MYSVSETIARTLAPEVDEFFGIMGNGNAWFVDALERLGRGIIPVRHEVATVAAADAYHRVTRRPAVATTTYGPGFTNTVTALADAAMSRTPLLLVAGGAPTTGARPWDVDQVALAASVGVETFTVSTTDATSTTRRALDHALRNRIPVVLEIPYDLAALPAEEEVSGEEPTSAGVSIPLIDADLNPFIRALTEARHPLILAGRGARESADAVRALAGLLHADVATSAPAQGLFAIPGNYRDLGVCGGFAAPGAAEEIRRADVVLVLGAGLNQFTMAFGDAFGADAQVVQVDLATAPTHPRVDHFLTGDVTVVATRLAEKLRADDFSPAPRDHQVADPMARPAGDELASDGLLDPRSLMVEMNRILPKEKLVASDGGHFIGWASTYLDFSAPDEIVLLGTASQSIGLGFPTAVGVAVAAGTEKMTVLATGDGGGLMALADAETFIRTAHRGVVLVFNDSAYGAEIHQYGSKGLDDRPMLIPEVHFAAVLGGLGASGTVVRELSDLAKFETWVASGEPGTFVLDCRVSTTVIAPFMQEMIGG